MVCLYSRRMEKAGDYCQSYWAALEPRIGDLPYQLRGWEDCCPKGPLQRVLQNQEHWRDCLSKTAWHNYFKAVGFERSDYSDKLSACSGCTTLGSAYSVPFGDESVQALRSASQWVTPVACPCLEVCMQFLFVLLQIMVAYATPYFAGKLLSCINYSSRKTQVLFSVVHHKYYFWYLLMFKKVKARSALQKLR